MTIVLPSMLQTPADDDGRNMINNDDVASFSTVRTFAFSETSSTRHIPATSTC
jgi:hypothetical protein